MFLQNVKCLRYGTLRYVTWGWKTRIRSYEGSTRTKRCYSLLHCDPLL